MGSLGCPQCSFEGPGESELRGHVSAAHLHYWKFGCPLCPDRRFASVEVARLHATVERHAAPFFVTESPDMRKETALAALLGRLAEPKTEPLPSSASPAVAAPAEEEPPTPVAPEPKKRRSRTLLRGGVPARRGRPPKSPPRLVEENPSLAAMEEEEEEDAPVPNSPPQEPEEPPSEEETKPIVKTVEGGCRVCGEDTNQFLPHAVIHAPAEFKAILCKNCPAGGEYGVAWQPSRLLGHHKAAHPGLKLDFTDNRGEFKEEIRELMIRCWGFADGRGRKRKGDAANESTVDALNTTTAMPSHDVTTTTVSGRTGMACLVCGQRTPLKTIHVVQKHLKERAIICNLCPEGTKGSTALWNDTGLVPHFRRRHPEVNGLDVTDRRPHLRDAVDAWLRKCFNTQSRRPRGGGAGAAAARPQGEEEKMSSEEEEEDEEDVVVPAQPEAAAPVTEHQPDVPGPSAVTPLPTRECPPATFRRNAH